MTGILTAGMLIGWFDADVATALVVGAIVEVVVVGLIELGKTHK